MIRVFLHICFMLCLTPSATFSQENNAEKLMQLEKAIEHGSVKAAYQLAHLYLKQNRDIEAEEWLQHAALLGHAPSAIELARHYADGRFQAEDGAARHIHNYAITLMAYGDTTEDPESLYALGEYYLAKQDAESAVTGNGYLLRAANAGHKDAMLAMAQHALAEEDVRQTHVYPLFEALYWLRRAAKKGSSRAWVMLAEFYMGDRGMTQNIMRARQAVEQAEMLGHPRAAQLAAALKKVEASHVQ